MILEPENNITRSLINFLALGNKVFLRHFLITRERWSLLFLNPQMIKVPFSSWLLNFNSINEDEAHQTNTEGSIISLFFYYFV